MENKKIISEIESSKEFAEQYKIFVAKEKARIERNRQRCFDKEKIKNENN